MAVQLKLGYDFSDFVGVYKTPASTAISAGTFVSVTNGAIALAAGEDADDARYIILQNVTTDGPSYQEIVNRVVQHEIKAGEVATIVPRKRGAVISTNVITTGAETGAITAAATAGTEVSVIDGVLRVKQAEDVAVGKVRAALDSKGYIEVELY